MKKVIQAERLSNRSGHRVNQVSRDSNPRPADSQARLTAWPLCTPAAHLRLLIAGRRRQGAAGRAPSCPSAASPQARGLWPRCRICGQSETQEHRKVELAPPLLPRGKPSAQPRKRCQGLTQQSARWSWSSANRRPMHILFPTPNGRWAKGLIFFLS